MISTLRHFFLPHPTNNHRPKLLHHKSLFVLLLLIVILSAFTFSLRKLNPSVLGVATDITIEDLVGFTNQKRQEQGTPPVVLNKELSDAAAAKANDMFAKDYWAHNAPDGTTPWVFIQNAGYSYIYAGENLAKDFADSKGVVNAWMTSPSHRDNMLSHRYDEVGFAVVNGSLNGQETTLVVQMFGRRQASAVASIPSEKSQVAPTETRGLSFVAGVTNKPRIDSQVLTKRVSVTILVLLIIAFILDMLYIERKKLVRLVGHNADHILFLTGVMILILFFGKGAVLGYGI